MKIITSQYNNHELPFNIKIGFRAIFDYLEETNRQDVLVKFNHIPELKEGFEDFTLLESYKKEISELLDLLFPMPLQKNEIKAVSIPFNFTTFKFSRRFIQILDDAGDDYEFKIRNFDESKIYILACTFILMYCYDTFIDFKRPFFFDIPDKNNNIKHYRTLFNGDFMTVSKSADAPEITKEDVAALLDNFDNIDLWKEKFPPKSYELNGFGLMNLFDVTQDETLASIKANLLKNDEDSYQNLQKNIANIFGNPDIKFGFSTYSSDCKNHNSVNNISHNSFLIINNNEVCCNNFFCDHIVDNLFIHKKLIAISNVEKYGIDTNNNNFYKVLSKQGIESIILVPFEMNEDFFGVMEIVSDKKYLLNSLSANKLKDIVPAFAISIKRYMEEYQNKLESVIQENYTAIHPSIKWRFYEAAQNYLNISESGNASPNLEDIVFNNINPLYGQIDIKGSSIARNTSIQKDLIQQLKLASEIMRSAYKTYHLPAYEELQFRIITHLKLIKKELSSGDEIGITDFLKRDIYPVFEHLKSIDSKLKTKVEDYTKKIDEKLGVIYNKRREYEDSVTTINKKLANYIDQKQQEAQEMYPHYFERYKTDGIEFNIYVGQSLIKNKPYHDIYLYNLRLWQLQVMCEMEQVVHQLKKDLEHPLEVASLILVHSNALAIKFRMDEKQFDVDGAYNIRYEIIKKRIDKALIKDSNERLTQPGKIAIVYTQEKDAIEYKKYLRFLQSKNYLLESIESLELEELQGITGLKALRVSINYKNTSDKISFNELMEVIQNDQAN